MNLPTSVNRQRAKARHPRHNLVTQTLRVLALGFCGFIVLAGLYFLALRVASRPPRPVPIITTEDELVAFAEAHLCKPGTVSTIRQYDAYWTFFCVTASSSLDIYDFMQLNIYGEGGEAVLND